MTQQLLFKADNPQLAPTRATSGSAGLDLRAAETTSMVERALYMIRLGVKVVVPEGHVGILALRSSLAVNGLRLANGVGIIDSDYRGELKLLAYADRFMTIREGERVAQLVVLPTPLLAPTAVQELPDTERGAGGFGSTGRRA